MTPFDELVVLDLATLNAAPQVATFFADLGATTIKIEPPDGDPLRHLVDAAGHTLQWSLTNRNKQCVCLDLDHPDGRGLLERMLSRADLVVSSLSGARLHALGLDADALQTRHPRVVAVNLTTYGTTGPWAERPGSGTLAECSTGLAHLTGDPAGPPTLAPVGLGDHLGVLQGIIAALVGLFTRPAGGRRVYDVAMTQALLAVVGQRLAAVSRDGVDPGRRGNRFPTMAPRNVYRAADGRWVAITAGTPALVRRLFRAMNRLDLVDDARFATNQTRLQHVDALDDAIGTWIGARSADDTVATLVAARVSAATVDDTIAVLANPHFRARGDLVTIDDPILGCLTLPAPFPSGEGHVRHLGRALRADTDSVFRTWLGLSVTEVERLASTGVI
jgi:crotonobetainyl-CoA:carnitine CoA-transferase CaiB-like acyl-CoA transferase